VEFWGAHGGTYYKSPAVEAKKHIFLHCNASNLVLKILQHDKIWGTTPLSPALNFGGGDLSPVPFPVIYTHADWSPRKSRLVLTAYNYSLTEILDT